MSRLTRCLQTAAVLGVLVGPITASFAQSTADDAAAIRRPLPKVNAPATDTDDAIATPTFSTDIPPPPPLDLSATQTKDKSP